jgi:hypothetical protein
MAARQIIVPGAFHSRDANGRVLPGKLRFYEPNTDTPATVYANSGLSVPHAFPILSDSAGRWPQIWADEAELFDVAWSRLDNDALIASYSDVGPLNSAVTASAILAQSAADAAVLAQTATEAAANAADALFDQVQDFLEPFGDITDAVTAAQLAQTNAETAETNAETAEAAAVAAAASAQNIGRHSLWVPAQGITPRTTNGAAVTRDELATNKVMRQTLDFDASTIEYAQFMLSMPKSWNEGAVTFVPVWSHAATTTNFKVSWGLQAVAVSDDDALDAAFGTAQYSNDEGGTTGDLYKGPESSAITIAGTPLAEDVVVFQVLRKADDATNDTLAVDAKLLGIVLYLTTDAGNDA